MSQGSDLQKDIYEGAQERQFQKRSRSVSSFKRQCWVEEYEHVLGQTPQRSVSLKSKVKNLPRVLHCVPVHKDDDYDSDLEDLENGVPIFYSENQGCPFSPSMKEETSQKVEEKLKEKRHHLGELSITKKRYFTACEWYTEQKGLDWDACIWRFFLTLEDSYMDLADEVHNLTSEINDLEAMLASFGGRPSTALLTVEGDGTVICSSSNAYNEFTRGEIKLEYQGINYNTF
ncbi:hypothetical protein F4819DRAFT_483765 [Hypoxylon fuscum]|nr:hypothetical protein F4819DRAFT_483765 [Hypoxylon fuscum]